MASFIAYFSVRQAEEPADADHPLRPREVRERRRGGRGRPDPHRLGRDRLRGDPQPRASAPSCTRSASASASWRSPPSSTSASPPGSSAAPARPSRPRWRATPRTCAPTRTPRRACSSASCSCRSPAPSGSTRSSRSSSRSRSSSPACGSSLRSWAVLVDETLPDTELDAIRETIDAFADRGIVGYHQLRTRRAGARRYVDLHVQFESGTSLEDAHGTAHALQDADRRAAAGRRRRADPPRAGRQGAARVGAGGSNCGIEGAGSRPSAARCRLAAC